MRRVRIHNRIPEVIQTDAEMNSTRHVSIQIIHNVPCIKLDRFVHALLC